MTRRLNKVAQNLEGFDFILLVCGGQEHREDLVEKEVFDQSR